MVATFIGARADSSDVAESEIRRWGGMTTSGATVLKRRLGFDVGGTSIKWACLGGDIVSTVGSIPTPDSPEATAAAIADVARRHSIACLGVAVPGHLTSDWACTTVVPNLSGQWTGFPLRERLEALAGVPTMLINDARAFAFAELTLGAARDRSDVLFLTMGTGVGGAIAVDGQILRGIGDNLGEIGHVLADPAGLVCACGARGCLETIAGGRSLVAAWKRNAPVGELGVPIDTTPEELVLAARCGDSHARSVLHAAGSALGRVLGSVLALLGMHTVVIGGGVAPALEFMRESIEAEVMQRVALVGPVEVLQADLGIQAGAIGAALHTRRTR